MRTVTAIHPISTAPKTVFTGSSIMKRTLIHALGGIALGVFFASPLWAQVVVECPNVVTAGATCPALQTVGTFTNVLAPSGSSSGTSPSLSGNSVTLNGDMSPAPDNVFGAVNTNAGDNHNVTGNSVFITAGSVGAGVYGGYTDGAGNATGNAVIIAGNTTFNGDNRISGGTWSTSGTSDWFTDNLLALHNYTGTASVGVVTGFASYEFLISDDSLPLNVVYKDTTFDGKVHFTPSNNVPSGASSTVTAVDLAPGQTLTRQKTALLCPDSGFIGTITNNNAAPTQASASYTFKLSQESDCLYAIVKPVLSLTSIGTSEDSMDFSVTSNIDTNAYWQVFVGARTCTLSDATGTAGIGGGIGGMTTGTAFTGGQTSLSADTDYTLCFVAGNYGVYSDVWEKPFKTAKVPAPTLSNGALTSLTASAVNFSLNSNMPITAFWKVIPGTDSCPSDADTLGFDPSTSMGTSTGGANLLTGSVTNLQPDTGYKLCLAAAGAASYFAPWEISFTTTRTTAPSVTVGAPVSSTDGTSESFTVTGTAGLSVRWQIKPGTICPAPGSLANTGTIPAGGVLTINLSPLTPATGYTACLSAADVGSEYYTNEVSFQTKDNGLGGGVGYTATSIPTLNEWALALLAMLMMGGAATTLQWRRRG